MEHRLQRQLSTIVESMLSELSHIPHLLKAKYKTKTFIVLKQVMQKDHVHSYHLQKTWICKCPGRISVYQSRFQLMSPFNKQTVLLRLKKISLFMCTCSIILFSLSVLNINSSKSSNFWTPTDNSGSCKTSTDNKKAGFHYKYSHLGEAY